MFSSALNRSALSNVSAPAEVGTVFGPTEVPLARIQIQPGVAYYDTMTYLVTADGAPVVATQPGHWGQLYAAGRM